jgi:hypothetical protein
MSTVTIPRDDTFRLAEFLAEAADHGLECNVHLEPCGWVVEIRKALK